MNLRNLTSHHDAIISNYHIEEIFRKQQYRRFRDYKNLNSKISSKMIEASEKLRKVFNLNDPNRIANDIILEFNRILNELAPSK